MALKSKKTKINDILEFYINEFKQFFSDEVLSDCVKIKTNLGKLKAFHKITAELLLTLDSTMADIENLDNYSIEVIDELLEQFNKADKKRLN